MLPENGKTVTIQGFRRLSSKKQIPMHIDNSLGKTI